MKRARVLYFFVGHSTFVQKDIEILSGKYDLQYFDFHSGKSAKWRVPILFIRQFLFLTKHIGKSSVIVCQFAGYHSYLPVLFSRVFKKRSLVIAGGVDCVSFPSIGYGYFHKKVIKIFTMWSFRNATHISPKHESLWICDYAYTETDYPKQGISYFIPGIRTPHTSIPNGYDSVRIKNIYPEKENVFITVTSGMEYSFQAVLKGLDLILGIAHKYPQYRFKIIGISSPGHLGPVPENVELLPPMTNENLTKEFSRAKFYFQLSIAEGFPNALCEAMLCECIPIVSDVFSLPEIVGKSGYVLKKKNHEMLVQLINEAVSVNSSEKGKEAREIIAANYPLKKREEKLLGLIADLAR